MPIAKKYDKDFFKTWSSDMAYVLGFMYADGNVVETKRGNHYVAIYSADKPIMFAMRRAFKAEHKISARISMTGCVYRIQIGSQEWFSDIAKLGLFPNKMKRLVLPKVPRVFFGDFIRGYFDGDGNVWSGFINKKRKTPTRVIQAVFTSGAHDYLVSLRNALAQQGIRGGGLYVSKKGAYSRLILSTLDALKLYEIMYNGPHALHLKRKRVRFEQFMKLRE